YASSSSVYGEAGGPLREEDAGDSIATPYAITKRLGERYVAFFRSHHGVPTVVLRLFNCYGPGERPGRYRNVIPNLIHRALTGRPLVITGTGDETRDFTYVDDVAAAFRLATERPGAVGGTFNIGSGAPTSVRELIDRIGALVGPVRVEHAPRRSWDVVTHRTAGISAARTTLGYSPRVGLDDGLRRTLAWLQTLDLERYDTG
ncbi:MAG: NAD-dependent epimerase/dehydratase family protein, partial [Elusimicrobia bacterium]|nr:NAD-dependent epimerase/dehydratase family protein [Elusimicrobiota bacterium]